MGRTVGYVHRKGFWEFEPTCSSIVKTNPSASWTYNTNEFLDLGLDMDWDQKMPKKHIELPGRLSHPPEKIEKDTISHHPVDVGIFA